MIATQEQVASSGFFVAVVAAWATCFLGLEVARRLRPAVWPAPAPPPGQRPWVDVAVCVGVIAAVLGIGQLWHAGWLRWRWPGPWDHLAYALAQALVWLPLPLAMLWRRQTASSAWTGASFLWHRLAVGVLSGAVAVSVFLAQRGELSRWPEILDRACGWHALAHFLPVYMEGVGNAFVFVRLQWAFGNRLAAVVPGLLFALAHVPRGLADGESIATLVTFFAFNSAFVTVLLFALARHRDVVALGVVHWWMDLAIRAF